MPIGSARMLGDLQARGIDRLRVVCDKCERSGSYAVARLIGFHGETEQLPDLLGRLTRDCPKRAADILDQCGAHFVFGRGTGPNSEASG
ncbi:MAG: hypothetical protein JWM36_619 [Hyphomicrobiales bacterium]|nr:hypothetical protein [Hyphomicrobiales bacterium]